MSLAFFDTNILVYCFARGDPRMPTARNLLAAGGCIGVQSLNEFANVAWRKMRLPWSKLHGAREQILMVCEPPVPVTFDIHEAGLALAEQHAFSIYDAMIVAAALKAGCDILYSEDMHNGLVVDGRLTIINPFAAR